LSSLSVGSIIRVPGVGNDIVGAWNPKSINLLAKSSYDALVYCLIGRISIMNS
jgi:hypothetical protein